jgi:hypothetical protein
MALKLFHFHSHFHFLFLFHFFLRFCFSGMKGQVSVLDSMKDDTQAWTPSQEYKRLSIQDKKSFKSYRKTVSRQRLSRRILQCGVSAATKLFRDSHNSFCSMTLNENL